MAGPDHLDSPTATVDVEAASEKGDDLIYSQMPSRQQSPLSESDRHASPDENARPPMSLLHEIAVVFTICLAQLWQQAGLGQVIAPLHIIGDSLGAASFGELSWYPAAYSLTVAAFILPAGRVGDMYGHRRVLCGGLAWYALWSLVGGFSDKASEASIVFTVCKALQGIGIAFSTPNAVAILGRTYSVPNWRKNLVFSLFGATAPAGFTVGALFGSLTARYGVWQWSLWAAAIASACFIALALIVLPPDQDRQDASAHGFDYWGTLTGITSLFLINVAINQGAVVGWSSEPGIIYLPILLIGGLLFFPLFCWTQLRPRKTQPLVPLRSLGAEGSFALAVIACCWGSFGIFVFYLWQLLESVRGHSVLLATAESSPVVVTGLLAALFTGWLLPRVKVAYIMLTAMIAFIIGLVLLVTVPAEQTYWAQTFVALLVIPVGLDMSFPAGLVMVSNRVPKDQQGVAGSLVNTVVNYSISLGLGVAATIEAKINQGHRGQELLAGYRAAWAFGLALDVVGLVFSLYFVLKSFRSHGAEDAACPELGSDPRRCPGAYGGGILTQRLNRKLLAVVVASVMTTLSPEPLGQLRLDLISAIGANPFTALRQMSEHHHEHEQQESHALQEMNVLPENDSVAERRGRDVDHMDSNIEKKVRRKLDFVLLPFLALFFLVNSLDRSNIGNSETANFTRDAGLRPQDLNQSVSLFFAVFVALQPVGATLGRKYGMRRWVPATMLIWGLLTCLHIWIRAAWQLYLLRILIGALEAGFYPTAVAYLATFYTRYEYAKRLGVFYSQYAIASALGGILAFAIFSSMPPTAAAPPFDNGVWRPWQILFLIEGWLTIIVAIIGFFYLPLGPEDAWFLTPDEREAAYNRIIRDRRPTAGNIDDHRAANVPDPSLLEDTAQHDGPEHDEEARGLLHDNQPRGKEPGQSEGEAKLTSGSGVTAQDIFSAAIDWKVWFLLLLNILSAIPASAFTVFLPLVMKGLGLSPQMANLLVVPPFLLGAALLWTFTWWSDRRQDRLVPILYGLGILLAGLTGAVMIPHRMVFPRYASLCVLMGGGFIASPLTISWLSGNMEPPGKRAVVLGINGWGNLAGVFSSLLFSPTFRPDYTIPFFITFALVTTAFLGFLYFRRLLIQENARRSKIRSSLSDDEIEAHEKQGRYARVALASFLKRRWPGLSISAQAYGDEKITHRYGL